ncbi:MAG TPA: MMPL family transporter [Gaiella sp.]|jgi:RND superfamily putative drug exporter|nr:MMPL family transporter [Gaiella sp.]
MKRSTNVAARMGRWSARHRKTAIFGWLAFIVAAVVLGGALGTKQLTDTDTLPGESGRAARMLDDGFKQPAGETVLVQSSKRTADSPAFRAAVADVVRRVSAVGVVTNVQSPYAAGNRGQISADGHSATVSLDIRGDADTASDRIQPVMAAVEAAAAANPSLRIEEFGVSAEKQLDDKFNQDLERAGLLSLPVTIVILVVAFGALVAAGIPLLLALSAVMATMGLLAIPSQVWPVDENISAIVLLIGLAVGVDYSMFYLKREREERAAGKSESAALEAAAATSGRSVLISGLTVMTAMAGMFLTGDKTFGSFAMATILVVAIAVLGSLTVLPALLSWLGDRVNKVRVPFLHRLQRPEGGRAWGWILDRVLAHPLVSVVGATAVLVALALPALGMKTVVPGAEALPQDLPAVQTYNRLQAAFPGGQDPATVVVRAPSIDNPQVKTAIAGLQRQALAGGQFHQPVTVSVNKARTVAEIDLPIAGSSTDAASNAALASLRGKIVPSTVGSIDGVEVGVTGTTAISKDFDSAMRSTAPLVFAFVLAFAFVLLLVSFRSIVLAVKAILLNLLSVAAAYGILVLVFQRSWAKGILDFDYSGGVMAFMPVFLFVILFGLSMDYHVFILSRIREAYDRGMKTEDAVAHGIKTTAGVVTSAAIVMVFVFGIFATLSIVMLKQFGVGLAAAVLIDATIVRAVLLPAAMTLLGDWNWYLPRWLEWLPKLEHERSTEVVPEPELEPARLAA